MDSLFDKIRLACEEVAHRASYVKIDHSRIEHYATSLPVEQIQSPQIDPRYHYRGSPLSELSYIIVLDAINFGSGYFPLLRKREGLSGYFTVALSLKERYERDGPLEAEDLTRLDSKDCTRMFGQEAARGAGELMDLFSSSLKTLGHLLQTRYDGSFATFVESCDASAEALIEKLSEMPFFRDVERYEGGLEVPFYKRAQITAADLHLAFGGKGYGRFDDIDRLTIFADNLVPHVLRRDGILLYDPDLSDKIEAEQIVPLGSSQEIEIRACALHAVEKIVGAIQSEGHDVTSPQIDNLLWHRGQDPAYKAHPRHRTRGVYY